MKFLIIGGDAAGMSAASKAKRINPDIEVTVLEKTADVSYSACGMPYNIADDNREIDDLVVRHARVFREKNNIDLKLGHMVENIDPLNRTVSGKTMEGDFEYFYDKLLIATGGTPVKPDIPGCDLPGVLVLKTLSDGRDIKKYIRDKRVKRAVIIGMGYIGLEMCEALHALGIETEMVKPGPVFLPWMEGTLSDAVKEEILAKGIKINMGKSIKSIEKDGNSLRVVCDGFEIETDMVLVAMGISPNSELAASAGLETSVGGSISVNRKLQTSDENIYAAGDCADAYHVVTGEKTWIPLALRANRAVADNICGNDIELPGIVGTAVFKVFDFEVARCGLTVKEAEKAGFDPESVVIKTRTRAFAHPGAQRIWVHMVGDKKTGRILGAQMVGKEGVAQRINSVAVAVQNHLTVEQFYQTDMAYAPPFGPVWDPTLTAAKQLLKLMHG
jgi:NADPH-dependent 2,4-dienoyl-CoA reductase/sulfur reductase-like enzyme